MAAYDDEEFAPDERIQGRTEALGNGIALGGGSRLGAAIQAGLAAATGGKPGETYDTALRENREILNREHAAEPVRAMGLEVAGGIPSTIAATAGGPKAAGGFIGRMRQAMATGGKVGGFAGAVGSQSDAGTLGQAWDTLKGGGIGAGLGAVGELATGAIGRALRARQLAQLSAEGAARVAPAGPEAGNLRVAGMAQGLEQQLHDAIAREGATATAGGRGAPGPVYSERLSGMRGEDVLWPGTDRVRIPAASDPELTLFNRLAGESLRTARAAKMGPPTPSLSEGTAAARPSSLTDPTAPQGPTDSGDRESLLRALRRALGTEETP